MRVNPAWSLGVLAGGRSERMGRDKATLRLGPRPLVAHQARRLAPPGVPVLLGTAPDGPAGDFGFTCLPDVVPGAGPLASTAALLDGAETPFVLVVPCDTPLLPPDLGDRLLGHASGADAVLISLERGHAPLPAFLSVELAPLLHELLADGERKMTAYLDKAPCALIPFSRLYPGLAEEEVFLNVNAPTDHHQAERLLGLSGSR